jgi:hypothetical protein
MSYLSLKVVNVDVSVLRVTTISLKIRIDDFTIKSDRKVSGGIIHASRQS